MKSHLSERFGTCARKDRDRFIAGPHSTDRLRYPRIAAILVAIDQKQSIPSEATKWPEKLSLLDQQR